MRIRFNWTNRFLPVPYWWVILVTAIPLIYGPTWSDLFPKTGWIASLGNWSLDGRFKFFIGVMSIVFAVDWYQAGIDEWYRSQRKSEARKTSGTPFGSSGFAASYTVTYMAFKTTSFLVGPSLKSPTWTYRLKLTLVILLVLCFFQLFMFWFWARIKIALVAQESTIIVTLFCCSVTFVCTLLANGIKRTLADFLKP